MACIGRAWRSRSSYPTCLLYTSIHAELIDLRTIKPLDFDTIAESVSRTNRLLIVEENKPFAGWGAQVAYEVQKELFDDLDAPVYRVTSLDVPQPYNCLLYTSRCV